MFLLSFMYDHYAIHGYFTNLRDKIENILVACTVGVEQTRVHICCKAAELSNLVN